MPDLSRSIPFTDHFRESIPAAAAPAGVALTLDANERQTLALPEITKTAARIAARDLVRRGVIPATEAEGTLKLESIISQSNLLPAWFLPVGAERARAICKIETSGSDYQGRRGSWMGTGFLISDSILMTNCHVLNSLEVATNATAIFNFEAAGDGTPLPTTSFAANPSRLFLTSPVDQLDCAFVWLDGEPGKQFGATPLTRQAFGVMPGQFVNIIQHPGGRLKELAVQENQVKKVDRAVIRYDTDTEGGSSGSCVFNNAWQPVALHHASREQGTQNEGIRFTAIAAFVEQTAENGTGAAQAAAREILPLFQSTDETMGFFGSLGRLYPNEGSGMEAVVKSFHGEASDIDVGFWNVEWFSKNYTEKVDAVTEVIVKLNLDIWALVESSPNAADHLVSHLASRYGVEYDYAASEPDAPDSRQTTTVIWNKKTVNGERRDWPGDIDSWFKLKSTGYQPGDFADLGLEAVEGKIFDRYPGLFHFEALNRDADQKSFDFFLVPLHLKAMEEGGKRRQLASEILAAAVRTASRELDELDWVLGGDYNAELATGDFQPLQQGGLVPISAADAENGAFTYLKSPKSLIDHVYLSGEMAKLYGADDYFIVAAEKLVPGYVKKVSDHRPVVVRLSLHDQVPAGKEAEPEAAVTRPPDSLLAALRELRAPAAPNVRRATA